MTDTNKFRVGDRVRVFGVNTHDGEIDGEIVEFTPCGWPLILYDTPGTTRQSHHPKQCRRLIPKKKERIWVNLYDNGIGTAHKTREMAEHVCQWKYNRTSGSLHPRKEWEVSCDHQSIYCSCAVSNIKENATAHLKFLLAECKEILRLYMRFESQDDAFSKTYNRTHVHEFNYPGAPKARALLEKLKEMG